MDNNSLQSNNRKRPDRALIVMLLSMLCVFLGIHAILGTSILGHSDWDSYTLQALSWLKGEAALDQNYTWLELAVYGGRYYVSFPPVPTLVMLPLAAIFGYDTPNNLVVAIYLMAAAAVIYSTIKKYSKVSSWSAAFFAASATIGTNLLWMCTNGGVWFQAQALNYLLCCGAFSCALADRRTPALFLLALAVGCRPFSALYFVPLLILFIGTDERKLRESMDKAAYASGVKRWLVCASRQWKHLILPVLIAAAMMWYNYIRFGSLSEFGHNYLPEFTESPLGQFSLSYIPGNLYNLFLRLPVVSHNGGITMPIFNGFMFYIANPFFILYFAAAVRAIKRRRVSAAAIALAAAMAINILLLCWHKTLGGWQFGARYTVDLLPFAVMSMLIWGMERLRRWEIGVGAFAVAFNTFGALAMTLWL